MSMFLETFFFLEFLLDLKSVTVFIATFFLAGSFFEGFELRLEVFFLRGIPDFERDFFELLEIGMISMASF